MDQTAPSQYKTDVREQYEDLPYPYRDPETEGDYFMCCDPVSLTGLCHAGWGGKRDLREGVRLLVAGCGTGDAVVLYAEELLDTNSEIIALDLSSASIAVAKARLKKRGLSNVTFHHLSILDAPDAGLGEFDLIDCSGVLHHLPDPDAGLVALTKMLKADGMMSIMVYGHYGRYSVYLVQELMKKLMHPTMTRQEKIALARAFLNNVPQGHWITVNNSLFLEDMRFPDGSGLYDLFLHSTDRAYTVPQIYDWVEGAGLTLHQFYSSITDESLYHPESYNNDETMRAIFSTKSPRERHEIAELMNGNIAKHHFYATKEPKSAAAFADDMVITYGPMQWLFTHLLAGFIPTLESMQLGERMSGKCHPFELSPPLILTKTRHVIALMGAIDGKRSIGSIVADIAKISGDSPAAIRHDLELLYHEYRTRQIVFLRHESIPPYKSGRDIIARVQSYQGK